ncbi:MAG: NUDIX domain-containing protein [Desulfovibrionales bacterium]|nr:NUDIX domain-containing protein [Desulfovibrionales bacterium]
MENPNQTRFTHCPSCGNTTLLPRNGKSFQCSECQFLFYMNCAAAAMGLITNAQGQLLVTRRKRNPAAGTLDFPGGFIEPGESAEEGLKREIKEELNLDVLKMTYLTSAPNTYQFKDVEYAVTDLAFICEVGDLTTIQADDDVEDFFFMDMDKINPNDFGLDSPKKVIRRYQQYLSQQG